MRTLLAIPLLVVLTACGGDGSAGPATVTLTESPSDPTSGYPACEDVWVVGAHLPPGYEGCYDAARDTVEAAAAFTCADGTALASFQDRWWVVGAGPIAEAPGGETASDPAYAEAYGACMP